MVSELSKGLGGKKMDLHIIARRILDDKVDINELKSFEFRTASSYRSGDALWACPDQFPIFVEYSGFHLLGKSENNGCENGETRMIERLCLILKYALDSSNPYISLCKRK